MEDRKYIPVTWGDIGRFFLFLTAAGLAVLNFYLLVQKWKLLYSISQLAIFWVAIGEYFLISVSAICLTALVKKGFKNLKPVKLILITWLIVGLIFGLITWLITWLITGLIFGLIFGLIGGLIGGLIAGLRLEKNSPESSSP